MGNIIIQNDLPAPNTDCANGTIENVIEIVNVAINDQLTELVVEAFTCGSFVKIDFWVGDDYINNKEPESYTGTKLLSKLPDCADAPLDDGLDGIASCGAINTSFTPAELGIKGDIINDFIVVSLHSKRCWSQTDIDPATGAPTYEQCQTIDDGTNPDECEELGLPDCQTSVISEARVGVASYASIYPALIDKIMHIDSDCAACSDMNDALTMDMLIKACTIYLGVDRIEEAWDAYQKARQMSQDYEDLFLKGPTACQTLGGIGCWIIDRTFIVSAGIHSPVLDPVY